MTEQLVLSNLRIWDGTSDKIDPDIDGLVIDDGKISYVGSSENLDSMKKQDMGGLFLIPGLIDAHIHLCLNPEIKDPLEQDKFSREDLLDQMRIRAKQMLLAGITTTRDLGGGQYLELIIRDEIERQEIPGPRLVCAGQPITTVKGHCHFWGGEAIDLEAALRVLERQPEHGVDYIKVMATGGSITEGSRPVDPQFDESILAAIVERANSLGYPVAAHCHGTTGIHNAANAGVTTIEHCSWVGEKGFGMAFDPDVVDTIAEKGIWVSPTVSMVWKPFIGRKRAEEVLFGNYERMQAAGVKLIASTDAGIPNVFHNELPIAMPVYAYFARLDPIKALKSATSDCAEAIGLGNVTGQIKAGYSADFILFKEDPTADLEVLASPVQVFQRGVAYIV